MAIAEIDVEVLGLPRPTIPQLRFDACPRAPAEPCVRFVRENKTSRESPPQSGFYAAVSDARGAVGKEAIPGIAHTHAVGAEPDDFGLAEGRCGTKAGAVIVVKLIAEAGP